MHQGVSSRRSRPVTALTARCGSLLALVGLAACQPAVLDPQGTVGAAQKTILIDSLAIMLAIVVPTIVATLGLRLVVSGIATPGHAICRTGRIPASSS